MRSTLHVLAQWIIFKETTEQCIKLFVQRAPLHRNTNPETGPKPARNPRTTKENQRNNKNSGTLPWQRRYRMAHTSACPHPARTLQYSLILFETTNVADRSNPRKETRSLRPRPKSASQEEGGFALRPPGSQIRTAADRCMQHVAAFWKLLKKYIF